MAVSTLWDVLFNRIKKCTVVQCLQVLLLSHSSLSVCLPDNSSVPLASAQRLCLLYPVYLCSYSGKKQLDITCNKSNHPGPFWWHIQVHDFHFSVIFLFHITVHIWRKSGLVSAIYSIDCFTFTTRQSVLSIPVTNYNIQNNEHSKLICTVFSRWEALTLILMYFVYILIMK